MANPNIIALNSIVGKSNTAILTTSFQNVLGGSLNTIVKINSIVIGNMDGAVAYSFSMNLDNGISNTTFANNISVPAQSTLSMIDKTASIYLEESHKLYVSASQNNKLNMLVSYEILS